MVVRALLNGRAEAFQAFHEGSIPAARSKLSLPGTSGFAAGRITALAAFLFEVQHVQFRNDSMSMLAIMLILCGTDNPTSARTAPLANTWPYK